jgi:raffinose synthase
MRSPFRVTRSALALAATVALAPAARADLAVKAGTLHGLDLSVDSVPLLERLSVEVKPRGADLPIPCEWPSPAASGTTLSLDCRAGSIAGRLHVDEVEPGVVTFAVDLGADTPLAAEDGLRLTGIVSGFETGTALLRSEPWWMRPVFFRQQGFLGDEAQLVLCRRAKDYVALLPLAAGGAAGFARGVNLPVSAGGLSVRLQAWAPWSVQHAPMAVVAAGASPYALTAALYRRGLEAMGGPGRLRADKAYPEPFTKIGFCSWNSFYENQTEANLIGAARAFREAAFPIGFLIIDAGWQKTTKDWIFGEKLQTFAPDEEKMPGGLKSVVGAMRKVSGARWIGVWHSIQGTPGGVDPASPLARGQSAHLWAGGEGALLPDPTSARGEGFYTDFYRYLKDAGVDLVKVDFQNWLEPFLRGQVPVFQGLQQSVYNLQAAAKVAFGNALISCMSMGNDVLFNLRDTNVVRNSLDYLLPEGPVGHRRHVANNVFNSLAVQQVAWPDFDMWEAYGDFAKVHSVLRALSGGPVYITGDLAKEDWGMLRRLILADGTLLRTDVPVVPTRDCLFTDMAVVRAPLKGFTRVGSTGLVGVFNVQEDGVPVAGKLRPGDVEDLAGDRFAVLEYFSRRLAVGGRDDALALRLPPNEAELYWIAPVENGAAVFGLIEKYVAPRTVTSVQDDGAVLRVDVPEGGTLGAYTERAPRSVRVDGAEVDPTWTSGLLEVALPRTPAKPHKVEIVR